MQNNKRTVKTTLQLCLLHIDQRVEEKLLPDIIQCQFTFGETLPKSGTAIPSFTEIWDHQIQSSAS